MSKTGQTQPADRFIYDPEAHPELFEGILSKRRKNAAKVQVLGVFDDRLDNLIRGSTQGRHEQDLEQRHVQLTTGCPLQHRRE